MKWWRRRERVEQQPFDPAQLMEIEHALAAGDLAQAETQLAALPACAFALAAAHDIAARLHLSRSQYDDAEACFETALALDPDDLCALCGLAELRHRAGDAPKAAALYARAVGLHAEVASLHIKLASSLLDSGRDIEAATAARAALTRAGADALVSVAAGAILEKTDHLDEAEAAYAAHRASGHAALAGLGRIARLRGDFGQAERIFREAAKLYPEGAYGLDIATALFHQRNYGEAITLLREALARQPSWAEARFALANALIANGERGGLARIRSTLRHSGLSVGHASGETVDRRARHRRNARRGCRAGLWRLDSGRALSPARPKARREVVLRCPRQLVSLMRASDLADDVRAASEAVEADWHCRMLSLPRLLGVIDVDELRAAPYLRAPQASRHDALHGADKGLFRIGLVWSGRPSAGQNRYRKFDPARAASLLTIDARVRIYSLQLPEDGVTPCPEGVIDLSGELHDFGATAALLQDLDLVVAAESGVAHLAGAMGVRTWVPFPMTADWRWIIRDESSPWYETVRLFQQSHPMEWEDVFERMAAELRILVESGAASRGVASISG